MARNVSALVLLAAVTAGCTTFQDEPISPETSAAAFEARRLDSSEVRAFLETDLHREMTPWPPKQWSLDLLALAACYYQPQVKVAQAQWQVAEAGIRTAGQWPHPALRFTPQYVTNTGGGISPWIVDFSVLAPIETAGKRGYRIARARNLATAARLNTATLAWQVHSRVRTSLLNLYTALHTESLQQEQVRLQQQTVEMQEKQLQRGEISQLVLSQARIALDQARLSLIGTSKQIAQDRAALAAALALPEAALTRIDLSFTCLEKVPSSLLAAEVRKAALWSRPDVLSSLADYQAAQSDLQLEIARQYPDISLGPAYEFDQGQNEWGIGLAVTLPIFNQNQGPIAAAEAKRREAAERFYALQISVISQVEQAAVGYSKALDVLKVAESILAQRTDQEKIAQRQFEVGDISRLELLTVEQDRNAASLSRLQSFVGVQQALGALEDAVMRPLVCEDSVPNPKE
ncbi:MAG: TolC family protein [Planctomycetes bacterium]|nr:TolC family protein [Planctomycetota bacterium]